MSAAKARRRSMAKPAPAGLSPAVVPASADSAPPRPSPTRHAWLAWFLAVLAFVLYAHTLSFDYACDDTMLITANQFTKKGLAGIGDILTNDSFTGFFGKPKNLVPGGRYRPLAQVLFAVEYQFFGLAPLVGHLGTVICYALTCALVYLFLRDLMPALDDASWHRSVPFLATAFFLVHPLHTEAVANIKGRDEVLSLLFSVATAWSALRFVDTRRWGWLAGVFAGFFLGLLAKENTLTFLAVIPLLLYVFRQLRPRDHVPYLVALLAATLVYAVVRIQAVGAFDVTAGNHELLNNPYAECSLAQKHATNVYTWGKYLALLVFPYPQTHDYFPRQIAIRGWSDPLVILSLALYLGLGLYAVLGLRRRSVFAFAILFFLVTFSISSNLVVNVGSFMNERFLFAPLLGYALVLACLLRERLPRWLPRLAAPRRWGAAFALVLLLAYSARSWARSWAWESEFRLSTTDVAVSANSANCNAAAGVAWLHHSLADGRSAPERAADLAKAEAHARKALALYPRYSEAWHLLAVVHQQRGDLLQARDFTLECLAIYPTHPRALPNLETLAFAIKNSGNLEESVKTFRQLARYRPGAPGPVIQLADQLSRAGQAAEGLELLQALVATHPREATAWGEMADICVRVLDDWDRAEGYYRQAYAADPANAMAAQNLAVAYYRKGDYPKSLALFEKADALGPGNPGTLVNLSRVHGRMGDAAKAEEFRRKAAAAEKGRPAGR